MSQENIDESFAVDLPAKLKVKNIRGNITIQAGEDNKIRVQATKHLNSGNAETTRIEISQDASGLVTAITDYEKVFSFWGNNKPAKVDYKITTPRDTSISISAVTSKVDVKGFNGRFSFKTVSGNQDIEDIEGDIRIKSVSGSILAKRISGDAAFTSVSGSITIEDSNIPELNVKTVSGRILTETLLDEGPYNFKTVSGRIKFIVGEQPNGTIRARSLSGRLKTDLHSNHSFFERNKWMIELGNGGDPEINMNTISGSMYVLSTKDSKGSTPRKKIREPKDTLNILDKLDGGELSVEEALTELNN